MGWEGKTFSLRVVGLHPWRSADLAGRSHEEPHPDVPVLIGVGSGLGSGLDEGRPILHPVPTRKTQVPAESPFLEMPNPRMDAARRHLAQVDLRWSGLLKGLHKTPPMSPTSPAPPCPRNPQGTTSFGSSPITPKPSQLPFSKEKTLLPLGFLSPRPHRWCRRYRCRWPWSWR